MACGGAHRRFANAPPERQSNRGRRVLVTRCRVGVFTPGARSKPSRLPDSPFWRQVRGNTACFASGKQKMGHQSLSSNVLPRAAAPETRGRERRFVREHFANERTADDQSPTSEMRMRRNSVNTRSRAKNTYPHRAARHHISRVVQHRLVRAAS